MTADIIRLCDHQSPATRERAKQALEEHLNAQMIEIANIAFPVVFCPGDHARFNEQYQATQRQEKDPA